MTRFVNIHSQYVSSDVITFNAIQILAIRFLEETLQILDASLQEPEIQRQLAGSSCIMIRLLQYATSSIKDLLLIKLV